MPKLFIDTNIYLDCYIEDKAFGMLQKVLNLKNDLIITEQVYKEFLRNRNKLINEVIKKLKDFEVKDDLSSPILSVIKASRDLREKRKEIKNKINEMVKEVVAMIDNPKIDPVLSTFLRIYQSKYVTKYQIEKKHFSKAWERKMLGNPPLSKDKSTIGDEVNWEILLANVKDDLVLVARDNTYFDNRYLLTEEFREKTGKELKLITKRLSEGLEIMNVAVTEGMKKAEDERIKKEEQESMLKSWFSQSAANDIFRASALSTMTASLSGVSSQLSDNFVNWLAYSMRNAPKISLFDESESVNICPKCGTEMPIGQDGCPICKE